MKYRVMYLPQAESDLEQIGDYIAYELKEPSTAKAMVIGIRKETEKLVNHPARHELYEDTVLADNGVRRQYYKNYIVFYHISEEIMQVEILAIRHMRVASQSVLYRIK